MPNFISEDDIEQAIVQKLQHLHGYDSMDCHTADPADLNDGSGRRDKREVILRGPLKAVAVALNPDIPETAIDKAIDQLCDRRQALSLINANRELDGLIRDGVRVEFNDAKGRQRTERVKMIDFENPDSPHNHFLVVTQLWIQSTGAAAKAGYRRPDILLYLNGLPLVFIELKNSNVKLRTAYDDNLTNYKADMLLEYRMLIERSPHARREFQRNWWLGEIRGQLGGLQQGTEGQKKDEKTSCSGG